MTDTATTIKLLYTPVEAAKTLSISRSTLYLLLTRGDLASIRIGGSRRIPATALADYIQRLAGTETDRAQER